MSIDTLIAFGGLVTGALSLFLSLRRELRQQDQDKINKYVRERMEHEQIPRVDLDCEIYETYNSQGRKTYKLKVENKGNINAYNVDVRFESSVHNSMSADSSVIPFEVLEPQHYFTMTVVFFLGMPSKFQIMLLWETKDGKKESVEKLVSW